MMKVLGIELKASRAIMIALEGTIEDFEVVHAGFIELKDSKDQALVKAFREQMMAFVNDHDFSAIGIKERVSKGRFAGGALTFKMEGLIQLSDYEITLVHSARLRSKLKDHDPVFGKIHSYQEEAARLAYYMMLTS